MRRLPPLNALTAFEATAQLGTVRAAADQLCVTASAVSHQIAHLEERLGVKLFLRQHRRLVLTEAGRNYLAQVEQAFDRLEEATADVIEDRSRDSLKIALPPSFTALWMMPRLSGLRAALPDLDLQFHDHLTMDACEDQVDCGVEYRLAPPKDRFSEILFADELVPLASPDLLSGNRLVGLSDLAGQTLIVTEQRLTSWAALAGGADWYRACPTISVRYSFQAFNAAMFGQGIALGNRQNAAHFIESGKLVVPFEIDRAGLPSSPRYYLSCRNRHRDLPKVQGFFDWMRAVRGEV
ncbi:LysR substrate-binding domain-containing protein [Aestuariispira insulae]|uniref:LysR family glycine cleavage system transcriptional activator n=1 Tax=Aestuariispira insulae TaxID=1461337 RepID=A0A3D9HGA6_9PROT|nr:LysR substrate-binding domain-containing protein [Aestuariispira insulae]RED48519.1 LysR family glycine cleavage system transcriptional activator [Aestuariispira insulae]